MTTSKCWARKLPLKNLNLQSLAIKGSESSAIKDSKGAYNAVSKMIKFVAIVTHLIRGATGPKVSCLQMIISRVTSVRIVG